MKTLTCGTEEAVAGWVVAELILAEQARSDRRTTLRARHIRVDPGLLAGLDVLDLEITPVGDDRDPLHAENLLCRFGGLCQQTHIHNLVGDLLLDDQLVLGVDRDLHVVAHRNMRVRRHRSAVGVGERDLALPGRSSSASMSLWRSRRSRIAAIFSARFLTREPPVARSAASLLSRR